MAELRAFIDLVRERYNIPYPLADRRPFVGGRDLLLQAQDESGLNPEFCLVAEVRGQYVLTPPAEAFFTRVTWHKNLAAEWRPHDDPQSPVRMNPEIRFGRPAVDGISTEVLWEHDQTGESTEEIANEFGLPGDTVRWALAYETSARAKAKAA